MLKTTEVALRAVVATDPSLIPEQVEIALRILRNKNATEPLEPILTGRETSALLGGVDRHTLLNWERKGRLRAIRIGGPTSRIVGYTRASVRDLLEGKESA